MAKAKEYTLKSMTDIKVFLLFILDCIRYPVDETTLRNILYENTTALTISYDECLQTLRDDGHLIFDEIDGERYYMISDTGRRLATELYDTIDPAFRERAQRSAMKQVSLSNSEAKIFSAIDRTAGGRYAVTLSASDRFGEILHLTLTVSSRAEAEEIRRNFETKPDSVYRGILFSATGKIGYFS